MCDFKSLRNNGIQHLARMQLSPSNVQLYSFVQPSVRRAEHITKNVAHRYFQEQGTLTGSICLQWLQLTIMVAYYALYIVSASPQSHLTTPSQQQTWRKTMR